MSTTPMPMEVYEQLPTLLKEPCLFFNKAEDKEAYLLPALALLGGAMSNYYSFYNGKKLCPNLHCFTINTNKALPASLQVVDSIHHYLQGCLALINSNNIEEYESDMQYYQKACRAYRRRQIDERPAMPTMPEELSLYVPADILQVDLRQQLSNSNGQATMVGLHGQAISTTYSVGFFPQLLGKSYNNQSLKGSGKEGYISQVNMSLVLSGSNSDLLKIIPNLSTELHKGFSFYQLPNIVATPFTATKEHYQMNEDIKNLLDIIVLETNYNKQGFQFVLSEEQQDIFLEEYQLLDNQDKHYEAILAYRITMILAVLYFLEENEDFDAEAITCTDECLEIAIAIARHYTQYNDPIYAYIKEQGIATEEEFSQEQLQVLALQEQGLSLRKIAAELYGDATKFMRVKRILSEIKKG